VEPYALPASPYSDVAIFSGNAMTAGTSWQTWTKPIGKAYAHIAIMGAGGGGGSGVIGAANAAGGGGGGGSGALTIIEVPLSFLPPRLYISVAGAKTGSALTTYVSTFPNTTSAHIVGIALGGNAGGNASGAAGGTAGSGGVVASSSTMPIGWPFVKLVLAGQAGGVGGAAVSAPNVALPVTGLKVTSGTGGGGLPSSGSTTGGSLTIIDPYPAHGGGSGALSATSSPSDGSAGYKLDASMFGNYYYGGTGGGSTNATATSTGLVQASGGNAAIGCGGGGMGAALTGATAGRLSYGGAGLVIITCY